MTGHGCARCGGALLEEGGSWPDAVVAVDSRKPCPVKIFADMPHTGRLCNTRLVSPGESQEHHGDDRSWGAAGASPTCMPGRRLGREPLPRAGSMFTRSPLAPVSPGVDSAAPPGFGIFGQFGPVAVATGNDHLETSPLERAAGRITTGKYAADMPRALLAPPEPGSAPISNGSSTGPGASRR